jgi:hypothetical protein
MRPSVQQPISKDKNVMDKKILFKKPLFDFEVKGQGPTKVITVRDTPPYGHAPTYQISLTYLERNNYLTLRSKVKVQRRSLWYATHNALWSCTHIPNIIDLSWKKQLFDLEVKVPRRSLWYATHRRMVIHPHTKYHWPISKDKNVMAQTRKTYLKNNYLTFRSKVKVPQRSLW